MDTKPPKTRPSMLGAVAGLALAGAGLALSYDRWFIDRNLALPDAIDAPRHTLTGARAGQLSYYADTTQAGRPLVLIHSINAAPSAHEMRPLFAYYRRSRPVYALDLPGFGFSERSRRSYTPALFTAAIVEFLRREVGEPADVVALSLGSEFAARAALEQPDLVRSLTLISPSGFGAEPGATQTLADAQLAGKITHSALTLPLLGQGLYDAIASRRSIHFFLAKSFVGPVPQPLVDYAYLTSHQPGAANAPLYFLSGLLFTRDAMPALYAPQTVPVLVLYDRDPYVGFAGLPGFLEAHPNWRAERITPTLGLPHWENLDRTTEALNVFWE